MKIYITDKEELVDMLRFYRSINKPYKYIRSGSSISVLINNKEYYYYSIDGSAGTLPLNQLYFIGKVKRHIEINKLINIKPNYKDTKKIKYFDYSRSIKAGTILHDCFSLDIKSAYWTSAHKEGFINENLFNEGNINDKRIRLASLGSFAKIKWNYTFDGAKELFTHQEKPQYPHVFFNNANNIANLMSKCQKAVNGDYIIHWVDGITVKTEKAINICKAIIEDYGYIYKPIETIKKIKRVKKCIFLDKKPIFLPE